MRWLYQPIDGAYVATLLLVSFSGVYLTRLGISPVYVISAGSIVWLISLAFSGRLIATLSDWAMVLGTCALIVALVLQQSGLQVNAGNILNLALGPLLAAVVPLAGRRLSRPQLEGIARAFVTISLCVATVEAVWRLAHPDIGFLEDASQHREDIEDIAFYAYKFNSLMYLDSNFVGLQLALLFAFLLGLSAEGVRAPRFYFAWTFLLTVLTLSRASVGTVIVLASVSVFLRYRRAVLVQIAVLVGVVILGVLAAKAIGEDASFLSKFEILHRFADFEKRASWSDIMFGVGAGKAVGVLNIGAHNIVVTYVVELGVVVSIIVLSYWLLMAFAVQSSGYLVIAWLINGFSLTSLVIPYMYASGALLMLLHRHRAGVLQGAGPAIER